MQSVQVIFPLSIPSAEAAVAAEAASEGAFLLSFEAGSILPADAVQPSVDAPPADVAVTPGWVSPPGLPAQWPVLAGGGEGQVLAAGGADLPTRQMVGLDPTFPANVISRSEAEAILSAVAPILPLVDPQKLLADVGGLPIRADEAVSIADHVPRINADDAKGVRAAALVLGQGAGADKSRPDNSATKAAFAGADDKAAPLPETAVKPKWPETATSPMAQGVPEGQPEPPVGSPSAQVKPPAQPDIRQPSAALPDPRPTQQPTAAAGQSAKPSLADGIAVEPAAQVLPEGVQDTLTLPPRADMSADTVEAATVTIVSTRTPSLDAKAAPPSVAAEGTVRPTIPPIGFWESIFAGLSGPTEELAGSGAAPATGEEEPLPAPPPVQKDRPTPPDALPAPSLVAPGLADPGPSADETPQTPDPLPETSLAADLPKGPPQLPVRATDSSPSAQVIASDVPKVPIEALDEVALTLSAPAPLVSPASQQTGIPTVPGAPPMPQLLAQVAGAVLHVEQGTTELALSPEELGHVRLRMEPDAANPDRMVVMISFERPETLDLFRRHAGELAEAIRQAGYSGADIGFGQYGSGNAPDQREGSGGSAALTTHDHATPTASTAPPRPIDGASLDLRL
jgi:hypothetical protein